MFRLLVLLFYPLLSCIPIPTVEEPSSSSSSDAFYSLMEYFRSVDDDSFHSAFEDFSIIEPIKLREFLKSNGKVNFQMGNNQFSITKFTMKMQNSIIFTGQDALQNNIFVKIFPDSSQKAYYKELGILLDSNSDQLLDFSHPTRLTRSNSIDSEDTERSQGSGGTQGSIQGFIGSEHGSQASQVSEGSQKDIVESTPRQGSREPHILILKYSEGIPFAEIVHDFHIGKHLLENPHDEAFIERLWPNHREITFQDYKFYYDIYLQDQYIVKLGEKAYIHPNLDPEKVIITPKNEILVMDYSELKRIPKQYMERKFLKAKSQEKLIDLFDQFSKAIKTEINVEILKVKIPDEILLNSNFDCTVSQIETVSQVEDELYNYPSISTIQEEDRKDDSSLDHQTNSNDEDEQMDANIMNTARLNDHRRLPSDSLNSESDVLTVVAGTRQPRNVAASQQEGMDKSLEVFEKSKEEYGYWASLLGGQLQNFHQDDDDDNDDDSGQLIMDGVDDDDLQEMKFRSNSKEINPSSSTLTESFYSTSSTQNESGNKNPSGVANSDSASSLSKMANTAQIANTMRRVSSLISSNPTSPKTQDALKKIHFMGTPA